MSVNNIFQKLPKIEDNDQHDVLYQVLSSPQCSQHSQHSERSLVCDTPPVAAAKLVEIEYEYDSDGHEGPRYEQVSSSYLDIKSGSKSKPNLKIPVSSHDVNERME